MTQKPMNKKIPSRKSQKNLPLWLALGGIVLIVLAVFAFTRGDSTPKAEIEVKGSPSLKADKEKVDLGDVKLGTPVEVSFVLTNVGDKTLQFTQEPFIEVVEGC